MAAAGVRAGTSKPNQLCATRPGATSAKAGTSGVELLHVPYRGSGPAMNDLVAGNVQLMVDQIASSIGQIRDGSIRALAVTGAERHPLLPEVPTVAEAGLPGARASSWGGLMVPARTPAAAIERLNAAAVQALQDPLIRERLTNEGQFLEGGTPAQFGEFLRAEAERWRPILSKLEVPQN